MKYLIALFISTTLAFALELNMQAPSVEIGHDDGGRVDGSSWSSSEIKGKIFVLFYVDPDFKNLNSHVSDALKAKMYDGEKFASIAVINMAATWLPNFAINASIKSKQKKFPRTTYVKDLNKILVKKWNLADDNSNVLVFDQDAKLLYKYFGKVPDDELKKMLNIIDNNI